MRVHLPHKAPPSPPLSEADHARLVQAAYKGDLPQLRRLAKEKPSFAKALYCATVNEDGWNVLMLSTLFCHMEVIEWLLSGCRGTENDTEEDNQAEETAGNEGEQAVNDIAAYTQMINQHDREGITAVFLASYHNHQSLLALLLAHGADPNKQHKDGLSPLGVAIYRGHLSLVREVLLPHPGLDVDARDDAGGRTALFQAAYWGKTEAVQLLLREKREGGGGADPMVLTKLATCAVQVARVKGHVGCVTLLEEWERAFLLHKLRCVHDEVLARQATTTAYSSFSASTIVAASSLSSSTHSEAASANAAARRLPWLQMHMVEKGPKDQQAERVGGRAGKHQATMTAAVLEMVVMELKGDLFGELKEYVRRTCGWFEE